MGLAYAGNKAEGRADHGGKDGNVFRMGGSHLHNRNFRVLVYAQESQRNAYVVVEVTLCCNYLVSGGKDCVNEFLCGGFSVGSGKSDYRNLELKPVVLGQLLQSLEGVVNYDDLFRELFLCLFLGHPLEKAMASHSSTLA